MGQKSSKQRHPWGAPPPGFGYPPNPYAPQGFIPPGFQPPPGAPPYQPFTQGFVPPGAYGQAGVNMPQPQLTWMPQDKDTKRDRKGKRRAQSEQFSGGFVAGGGPAFPQPNVAPSNSGPVIPPDLRRSTKRKSHRRAATMSGAPPPLTTPQGSGVPLHNFPANERVGTPFIPAMVDDEDDDDDDDDSFTTDDDDDDVERRRPSSASPSTRHRSSRRARAPRRSRSTGHYPEITGRIDDVLRPLPPAKRSAFGPTGQRPAGRPKNKLPEPPRDLYEMSPYKSLLTLPQTTALLTASYQQQQQQGTAPNGPTTLVIPSGGQGTTVIPGSVQQPLLQPQAPGLKKSNSKRRGVGGLFRALSGRRPKGDKANGAPVIPVQTQVPKVEFVPVFVDRSKKPGSSSQQQPHASGSRSSADGSHDHHSPSRRPSEDQTHHYRPQPPPESAPPPQPPPPASPLSREPLFFDQQSQAFYGFMNHSPHRVVYEDKIYPTATHLHEALKFLPNFPEMAERIRLTQKATDVYDISSSMSVSQRPDWANVFLMEMEEVLARKFRQHADLREKLVMETGERPLVYSDPLDSFWGVGPQGDGQNQLGRVLMRVRDRLRREGGMG